MSMNVNVNVNVNVRMITNNDCGVEIPKFTDIRELELRNCVFGCDKGVNNDVNEMKAI